MLVKIWLSNKKGIIFRLQMVWLLILCLGLTIIPGRLPVEAATIPGTIRVGVVQNCSTIDFGSKQGIYKIVDAKTGQTIVDSASKGALFRAKIDRNFFQIELFEYVGQGDSDFSQPGAAALVDGWKLKGAYNGPIRLVGIEDESRDNNATLPRLVLCESKRYRGQLEIRINANRSGLTGINELPFEEYLYGVVAKEMSAGWPPEALKAQAIIARTYAAQNLGRHSSESFNICATTNCQVYGGYDSEDQSLNRLVGETKGQVLVDNQGRLAVTLYHSNSGGYTENNVNVFGADIDYLQGGPDPYSLSHVLSDWSYATVVNGKNNRNEDGLRNLLMKDNSSVGLIESIELIKYPSGRVNTVIIHDDQGNNITVTGATFSGLFNPNNTVGKDQVMGRLFDISTDASITMVNSGGGKVTQHGGIRDLAVVTNGGINQKLSEVESSYYVVGANGKYSRPKDPTTLDFQGHGWGHGVGLSQWGAYEMAKQGFKHNEILDFYYPGTKLILGNR